MQGQQVILLVLAGIALLSSNLLTTEKFSLQTDQCVVQFHQDVEKVVNNFGDWAQDRDSYLKEILDAENLQCSKNIHGFDHDECKGRLIDMQAQLSQLYTYATLSGFEKYMAGSIEKLQSMNQDLMTVCEDL